MITEVLRQLPKELIYYILTFNRHFILRKGKLITINNLNLFSYATLKLKLPVCLSEYGDDYEYKEYSVFFSNPQFKLFYNELCNKIVFEKETTRATTWYVYYLK